MSLIDTVLGDSDNANRALLENAKETLRFAMEALQDYPRSKEMELIAEALLCIRKLLAL